MTRLVDELVRYLEARRDERPPRPPLEFAADTSADDGGFCYEGAEFESFLLTCPSEATVLVATGDANALSVVFEYIDDITGLTLRATWAVELRPNDIANRLVICKTHVLQREPHWGDVDPMLRLFGFNFLADVERSGETIARVQAAVLAITGNPKPHYATKNLLANNDLIYVPSRGIGSAGFLVNRATWHAWELGSGRSPAKHIWAHYKGFADGQTERLNDLVILHIHDEAATHRFLRDCFTGRFYWNELRPMLRELPARVRDVEWYFLRNDLWQAELFRWFEFRVEPASSKTSA